MNTFSLAVPHFVRRHWRGAIILALSFPMIVWLVRAGPLAQNPAYHNFADQRTLLGVPYFWNVMSNLPFAIIGLLGCWFVVQSGWRSAAFARPLERVAYFVFFFGEVLTAFGSTHYHAGPTNATLLWDRLGLSLMLASFFTIVVTEFVSARLGRFMLVPMVLLGLSSVLYWWWSEWAGQGDLRFYILVQFYPVIVVPLVMLLFQSRYTHGGALFAVWALYAVAKACELYDSLIFELLGVWSGHTLKHLIAAAASFLPLYSLRHRRLRSSPDVSARQGMGTVVQRVGEDQQV